MEIVVCDEDSFMREMVESLVRTTGHHVLGIADTRTLVVVDRDDESAILSFRNLPKIQLIESSKLNAYDVLKANRLVITEAALNALTKSLS